DKPSPLPTPQASKPNQTPATLPPGVFPSALPHSTPRTAPARRAPRKIGATHLPPQKCQQMIPLRSRSDSLTFTPGPYAIGIESNFSRCPTFRWYNELSFEEILKRAAALPPQSAIFWHLMNVDAVGVVHEDDKALKRLYAVANAPIFSHNDTFSAVRLLAARCTRSARGAA